MGIFKKIIGLFKKPPPPPLQRWTYISYEELIRKQRELGENIARLESSPGFTNARVYYNNDWHTITYSYTPNTETRKRIPVNKEIDPFEEEIWYEDETKTN